MTLRHFWKRSNLLVLASMLLVALMTSASGIAHAQDPGQAKLDEATEKKLTAESPADLSKVIELCEQAIDLGLDEVGSQMAKSMLAAAALQRAQHMLQNLPRVANNPNALRNLSKAMRADLDKAIANNPKLADAYILLAQLETLPGGSRERALEYVDSAIKAVEDKPVEQASAYALRARLSTSVADKLADLNKAIELDPTNTEAWQTKIAMQLTTGEVEQAAKDAESLLARDESNQFAFQVAVSAFTELKRFDEARALITRRIEKEPDNGVNYRLRGRLAMVQNKNEEALVDLNKALEIDQRDFEALLYRGHVYLILDEVQKASRDVSDSLLIEPDSIQGMLLRSLIAAHEERFSDAIKDMEVLVRHDPTNEHWIQQLAAYYQMDKRPRLAIRVLDELVSGDPSNWQAFRSRGDARLSISEHKEAIEDYRRAVRIIETNLAAKNETKPVDGQHPARVELSQDSKSHLADEVEADAIAADVLGTSDDDAPEVPQIVVKKEDEVDQASESYSGLFNNLAWLLATSPDDALRNGQESLDLALKACEATEYKAAHIISTLAAAYAEVGNFEKAREWATKAVEMGKLEGHEQLEQLEKELDSYKNDKPWREEQATDENANPLPTGESIDT